MNIKKMINQKDLVGITRKHDQEEIQSVILDHGENLLFIQYIFDFYLDGYKIINKNDIIDISISDVDILQKQILINEKLLNNIKKPFQINLSNWKSSFNDLKNQNVILSVENETTNLDFFLLGKILDVLDNSIKMKYFDGMCKWNDISMEIKFKDIKTISLFSNYNNKYANFIKAQNTASN